MLRRGAGCAGRTGRRTSRSGEAISKSPARQFLVPAETDPDRTLQGVALAADVVDDDITQFLGERGAPFLGPLEVVIAEEDVEDVGGQGASRGDGEWPCCPLRGGGGSRSRQAQPGRANRWRRPRGRPFRCRARLCPAIPWSFSFPDGCRAAFVPELGFPHICGSSAVSGALLHQILLGKSGNGLNARRHRPGNCADRPDKCGVAAAGPARPRPVWAGPAAHRPCGRPPEPQTPIGVFPLLSVMLDLAAFTRLAVRKPAVIRVRRSCARVAERQTRWLQVPVSERAWGFKSPLAHAIKEPRSSDRGSFA